MACPVLGTVRVAEAPGSRAAAGRRAAIAERPLGLEGRPGNLRGANHTITDVTGRTIAVPGSSRWGLAADGAVGDVADDRTDGRSVGASGAGSPVVGNSCGSGLPAGQGEGEAAAGEHGHRDQRLG